MRILRAGEFEGATAWDADHLATIDGATVKLHWTDQPYVWHVNDGEEVFAVLDGAIDMHVREDGSEHVHRLEVGDVFFADIGTEHVARPIRPSRVLVVERAGSV
jgi:mannose-6-phosphate isomerase-like protein (cupin superfamily)